MSKGTPEQRRGRAQWAWQWLGRAFLIGCCVAHPGSARAYVSYMNDAGQAQKWNLVNPIAEVDPNVVNRTTHAVRYFLAPDAYSNANKTAELNAARACFDQWQAIPGSILRFEEGGPGPSFGADVNTKDNTNLVYWAKNTTIVNGGFDSISGITGATFSDFFSDNTLAEADIVLNGAQFSWFTDYNNTVTQSYFVEAILLHEIGHLIGLAHSPLGASTMFTRGAGGISPQAGLSSDEIAAVHALYPAASVPPTLGQISGLVRAQGAAVFGAIVTAEGASGTNAFSTMTQANGRYELLALPPDSYQVRVSPVDPVNGSYFLFRGSDVAPNFATAEANFLPSADRTVTVTASGSFTIDFDVVKSAPPFRIDRLWPPTTDSSFYVVMNSAVRLDPQVADVYLGVYSTDTPGPNALLRVTGNGLSFGPTNVKLNAFPGLNLVWTSVHIDPSATPGIRSLVVQQENGIAYANGFLEIPPSFPDFNFDGLDDRFQRQYFPRWTSADAAPHANPDGDLFDNTGEYQAGTNPIDPASVLRVESVHWDSSGATVSWPSAPGKRYQVLSRPQIVSLRGWQTVGASVVSTGDRTQFLDTTATSEIRFYRVQALP